MPGARALRLPVAQDPAPSSHWPAHARTERQKATGPKQRRRAPASRHPTSARAPAVDAGRLGGRTTEVRGLSQDRPLRRLEHWISLLNRPPGGPALPPSPWPVAAGLRGPGPSSGCLVVSESDAGQFGDFAKLARRRLQAEKRHQNDDGSLSSSCYPAHLRGCAWRPQWHESHDNDQTSPGIAFARTPSAL